MRTTGRSQDRELTRPGDGPISDRAADRGSGNGPLITCLAVALVLSIGSVLAKMGTEWRWTADMHSSEDAGSAAEGGNAAAEGAAAAREQSVVTPAPQAWRPERVDAPAQLAQMQTLGPKARLFAEAVDGPAETDTRPYDYDFVIVVPAAAGELERRDAVRGSWARYLTSPHCEACRRYKIRMVFIVGNEGNITASHQEAAEKGDVGVLEDFGQQEYYTMRSRKTLLSIRYAVQHFTFRFLLKCDTDSWVYVDRLLELFEAQQLWTKPVLYAGNFIAGDGAVANHEKDSKWYDPMYAAITGFNRYPKHAKGAGYVLSRLLAEALANEPDDYWADLPCEDVAVGFWLSAVRNEKVELPVSLDPACGQPVVVDHYVTPEVMAQRWQTYEKAGSPCFTAIPALRGARGGPGGGFAPTRIDTDGLG